MRAITSRTIPIRRAPILARSFDFRIIMKPEGYISLEIRRMTSKFVETYLAANA